MSSTLSLPPTDHEPGCAVLNDIGWEFYERFLSEFGERRVVHSFVDGELAIMSPLGFAHEHSKHLLARLICTITEELQIPIIGTGSLTLKSAELSKGAEPEVGYYIANESTMRGKRDYDPANDPPPDLLLEIDVSCQSLNRIAVYGAIGVPEVWVYDGVTLSVKTLEPDGAYGDATSSNAFPTVPVAELSSWISRASTTDEVTWIRSFREWIQGGFPTSQT